jgi:RNA polymerase sigma-70 factor (ECF subfamily)
MAYVSELEASVDRGDTAVRSERLEAIAAYHPELLALARLLVGQDADARDLVQDTVETAIRHWASLRDPSRLRSWLVTIEARLARRGRRRLWRFLRLDHGDQETTSDDSEEVTAVRIALRRLPRRMRAAVVLHHMVGLSVDETAGAMAVSSNTIKSELKEGLRRMREMME